MDAGRLSMAFVHRQYYQYYYKMARINEALDHSGKLLRNIYTNIPVGIELYDKDGYLVDMNNKDVDIFGLGSKKRGPRC